MTGEYDVTEVEGQKVNMNNDCLKPKHNNPCCCTIPDLPSPACAGGHDGDRHHGPPPRQQGGAGEDWQVRLHHRQVGYMSRVSRMLGVIDDEYYFRYDVFEICFISAVPSNMRGSRHEVGSDRGPSL